MRATVLRQLAYALCATVGLVGTWYFNLTYTGAAPYLAAWFANAASSSAAVDLLVAFVAGAIFIVAEGRRLGMRWSWVLVVLGVGVGVVVAFAFPLFLLLRERVLARGLPARGAFAR